MDILCIDSDSEVYSETSDSEDQDENEFMYGGHAQNILSSLDESIGKIDDLLAYERSFLHGDIVSKMSDPSGQLGRVVDVDMVVDLETSSGDKITDVNSKKLSRVRSFIPGDYVVMGPWIGMVVRAFDMVTVLFHDGAKCEILAKDASVLEPIPPFLFEDAPYLYYPDQHIRVNLPTVSRSATWLCGSWGGSRDEGTVCDVEVGLVQVSWITSVTNVWGLRSQCPPNLQEPENLTLLSCFPYANWQLGEWCTIPVDCYDSQWMMTKKFGSLSNASNSSSKMHKGLKRYGSDCLQIVKRRSTVDVLWQDGKLSIGTDPQSVVPVSSLDDHDFWPGQFVLEKAVSEDACAPKCQRSGVVKSVDAVERTVKVKWIISELDDTVGGDGNCNEETVSAYELVEHPDFSFCIGELVLRPALNIDKIEAGLTTQRKGNDWIIGQGTTQVAVTCESYNTHSFLSCVGNVIGYKDEGIEVKWGSDVISMVRPSEIIGLDRLLDNPAGSINEEPVPASVVLDGSEQKELPLKNTEVPGDSDEEPDESCCKATAFLFPRVAFDFLRTVAFSFFGARGSPSSATVTEESKYEAVKTAELESNSEAFSIGCLKQPNQLVEQIEKTTLPSRDDKLSKFKQFDFVSDCSDHHFVKETGTENVKRGWLKKIQQEWRILQNDLPDTIYVRAYEERMDLLRASIVGVAGTPYHDGLFFFDIFFPPNYPHEPPSVHYHSGGLRLNPNLYESGKVCLSLLKTWTGTGTEVWNPESSTVLQVLLSLQALVLNEKPYFNEADYDKQIGKANGEKNSITYNENAFLLSCKSMMYLLHKPPKNFEKLVEEHFMRCASHILDACRAYLGGALVGYPDENEKVSDEGSKSCSAGFKIMLLKLVPKLIAAFTETGINCGEPSFDPVNHQFSPCKEHVL